MTGRKGAVIGQNHLMIGHPEAPLLLIYAKAVPKRADQSAFDQEAAAIGDLGFGLAQGPSGFFAVLGKGGKCQERGMGDLRLDPQVQRMTLLRWWGGGGHQIDKSQTTAFEVVGVSGVDQPGVLQLG